MCNENDIQEQEERLMRERQELKEIEEEARRRLDRWMAVATFVICAVAGFFLAKMMGVI